AVINEREAAGLMPIPPNVDRMFTRQFGPSYFPAHRCGGLFSTAHPGSLRPIDVVIPCHARDETEILREVAAHAFAEEFLPAIPVFGHGRIGIFFLESNHVRTLLLFRR